MSNPIFFAPYQVPLVDVKSGIISREWYLLFQAMFQRSGGSTGASNDDLEQLIGEDLDISGVDQLAIAQAIADMQALGNDPPDVASDPNDALLLLLDRDDVSSANPSAKVGTTAVNGTASTFMRSDAAPPLDLTINVTWTGSHAFQATASPISIGGIGYTGGVTLPISNTSTVDGDTCRVTIGAGATSFAVYSANVNQSTAIVTGGPTGAQSVLRTLGAQPIVFGTANTYRGQFTAAGGFQIAGAFGANGSAAFAQPTGYGTPTGGAHQASFAAGSITLPNLAAAVAQLIIELKAYGLIGT